MVGFWTFSWSVIVDVTIPYSTVYIPARNGGPMFLHQWWFCPRRHHLIIAIQILLADVQACLFMQHCELFGDPFCTNCMKAKFVVDDFIGRTMTNLQTICYFINSQSSNIAMSCTCSMLFAVVAVCLAPSCVTLVRPFFNFSIHSYTLCCGKTLIPCCAESLRWFLAPDTPSDHKKWIAERCSSLVQTESWAAMVNITVATKELT